MVESASFAINSLLRSFAHQVSSGADAGDQYVLMTDTAYMMVKNCTKYLLDNFAHLKLLIVEIKPPIDSSSSVCCFLS